MKKLNLVIFLLSASIFAQPEISYQFEDAVDVKIKSDTAEYVHKMYVSRFNSNTFALSFGRQFPLQIVDYSIGKAYHLSRNYDADLQESAKFRGVYERETKLEDLKKHYSKNQTERTFQIIEGKSGIDTLIVVLNSQYKKRKKLRYYSKTVVLFTKSSTDYWHAFDHILKANIAVHAPLKLPFPIKIISFTEEVNDSKSGKSSRSGILVYTDLKN